MVRTQIQLTERQTRRLKSLAVRQGTSVAELIRRAVDRSLDAELVLEEDEAKQRALAVVGKYADTASDLAEHHDRYLTEALLS